MKILNEDFEVLNELLRTAYKLISPISYHDDIKRLTPEFLKRDSVKTPGCYLAVGDGTNNTIFPICNRYGYKDPDIIRFSLKLAKKMAEKECDHPHIPGTIVKLQRLLSKYDKPVPNTMSQALLKSKATKSFNQKTFKDNKELMGDVQEGVADGIMAVSMLYQALRPMVADFMAARGAEKDELRRKIIAQKQKIVKAKANQAQA